MKKLALFLALCAGGQFCTFPPPTFAQEPGERAQSNPFYLAPIPEAYGAASVRTKGLPQRSLDIDPAARTLVLITMGQSLMANFHAINAPIYVPTNSSVIDNFNIYDGAAYAFVRAPAVGCNGYLSNVATRVADMLVNKSVFDRIIVVPIAVGSTTIDEWTTGDFASRFPVAMRRLAASGITPATPGVTFAAVWGQGESDTRDGTSRAAYRGHLDRLIETVFSSGFSGRLFVNVESYYLGRTSSEIRAAQTSVVNGTTVFQGADWDALGRSYRLPDNLHPGELGAPVFALTLYKAMRASGPPF
jgi:Carbohydrate esterase, sialic acid-specific acetylesterase